MKVLIIDDEEKITDVLTSYFERNGDQTYVANTGEQAIEIMDSIPLDMIILDLMLPDIDGEEICRYAKLNYQIPVIMLTAKISIEDKVNGFNSGADDYVVKPFHPKEILIRAERLLPLKTQQDVIRFGDLTILKELNTVKRQEEMIQLTQHEATILCLLAENPKKVYSRDDLLYKMVGGVQENNPRVVDQHIKNLRKKLNNDYIQTVFGIGYKMNEMADGHEI
ncbi:response regulator transcription factor [Rummeliibacillus sp. TYF-LIM-RU47]|uniref:response regulator transcription factor n=1 Tax=Rummeliibacillus sp. TYF-LIM-RU47 TaxID=2608406 RepID=UPI0016808AF9|nr:response regulator transcription factor [Rummeliibacillus sp. TYF-LIM-RU47]